MFVSRRRRYSDEEAREAIAASLSYSDALRRLGIRPAGGNHRTLKLLARRLGVPTDHFDPHAVQRDVLRTVSRPIPLEQILVRGSNYNRHNLKLRLYGTGLKQRACEMCGQGELWRGRRMSLILDHINGEATDNRLENLRIVCPNCAATLDTHCGKALRRPRTARTCQGCGAVVSDNRAKRYCSHDCYALAKAGVPQPQRRVVERPPLAQLLAEIEASSWSAVGRRYGVSDNAVRKWVRQYHRERASPADGQAQSGGRLAVGVSPRPARNVPTYTARNPVAATISTVAAARAVRDSATTSGGGFSKRRTPANASSASRVKPLMPTTSAQVGVR